MREIFKNGWLKFGCYITGYNYNLLKDCSEISKNYLKKITSALFIVSIIWAFIGFLFCTKYLQLPYYGASIGSFIMLIVVIQIERQIILSFKPGLSIKLLRFLLGIIIAIIGSTIVDQVLFKSDIDIIKKDNIAETARKRTEAEDKIYLETQKRIHKQISEDSINIVKYDLKIGKNILVPGKIDRIRNYGANGILNQRGKFVTLIDNPLIKGRDLLRSSNNHLNIELSEAAQSHLEKVKIIQKEELGENPGFLNELGIMVKLLGQSGIALIIYLLWFLFFLIIELFILFTTSDKSENDYDRILEYQMSIRETRLKALQDKTNNYLGENLSVNQSKSLVDRFPS